MRHAARLQKRLSRSKRVRIGALVLALFSLAGIFAELLAADAPVVAIGPGRTLAFPAIVSPESYRGLTRAEIEARHAGDFALWPLVHYGPETIAADGAHAPASWSHPLGTDMLGRDIFARLVHGTRAPLGVALLALSAALLFGVLLGAFAGYVGGFWDELVARPAELIETFPAIVVVAVVRAVEPDHPMWSLAIAVAAVRWAEIARLVRAEVIRFGASEFVEAARALGCGHLRVLWRHILPHALRPVIVTGFFAVPSVVLLEAAVSFLGFGVSGSWGVMLAEAASHGWRAPLWAGIALAATVCATYMLADAVGEALDARVAATSRTAWWSRAASKGRPAWWSTRWSSR
jgi:peptide/nickel transport system permease protein